MLLQFTAAVACLSAASAAWAAPYASSLRQLRSRREPAWTPRAAPAAGMNINVLEYGCDPTGTNDSSACLVAAFQAASNVSQSRFPHLGAGVTVDLVGGTYLIAAGITLQGDGYTGITLRGGSLVAAPTFAASDFLLTLAQVSQIAIEDVTFDNQHVGGGLRADTSLQSTVSGCFFLHYRSWGILGDSRLGQGHELGVYNTYFAEFMWGEPGYDNITAQNGTAIEMRFPDSTFIGNVIRCTRVGVRDSSGSNVWIDNHIYASCNKDPSGVNVAVGFISNGFQPRISNNYFDDSPVVVTALYQMIMTGNLFYGLSGLVLVPGSAGMHADNVLITHNLFTATEYAVPYLHVDTSIGSVDVAHTANLNVWANAFDPVRGETRTSRPSINTWVAGTSVVGTSSALPPVCVSLDVSNVTLFGVPYASPPQLPSTWREAAGLSHASPLPALTSIASVLQSWHASASLVSASGVAASSLLPVVALTPTGTAAFTACVSLLVSGDLPAAGTAVVWNASLSAAFEQSTATITLTP